MPGDVERLEHRLAGQVGAVGFAFFCLILLTHVALSGGRPGQRAAVLWLLYGLCGTCALGRLVHIFYALPELAPTSVWSRVCILVASLSGLAVSNSLETEARCRWSSARRLRAMELEYADTPTFTQWQSLLYQAQRQRYAARAAAIQPPGQPSPPNRAKKAATVPLSHDTVLRGLPLRLPTLFVRDGGRKCKSTKTTNGRSIA